MTKNFKLFVDVEGDFYYKIPSPHFSQLDRIKWRLNKIRGRLYRYPNPTRNGFINIINVLKKYNCPATFCICGHLYLKGNNPGLYFGDIIEKIKNNKNFKFGLHGFSHEALTLERKEDVDKIIKQGIEAAKKIEVKIESFGAPFEMIEDVSDKNKVFDVLKKYKIKEAQYAGKDDGLKILRKFKIEKPINRNGIKLFWISNYLEGTSSLNHVKKIIQDIKANKDKNKVYVLSLHDFTFRNNKNLEIVLRSLSK